MSHTNNFIHLTTICFYSNSDMNWGFKKSLRSHWNIFTISHCQLIVTDYTDICFTMIMIIIHGRDNSGGVCPGRGGDTLVGGGGGLGRLSCTARGRPTGPGPGNIGGYKATGQTLPLGHLQLLHWTLCHSYLHITTLRHRYSHWDSFYRGPGKQVNP